VSSGPYSQDTRAPIFDGTCATPESVVTPLVADPATGTLTPYLRQARFQKLCDATCFCGKAGRAASSSFDYFLMFYRCSLICLVIVHWCMLIRMFTHAVLMCPSYL
jgi:hypothetical protein